MNERARCKMKELQRALVFRYGLSAMSAAAEECWPRIAGREGEPGAASGEITGKNVFSQGLETQRGPRCLDFFLSDGPEHG